MSRAAKAIPLILKHEGGYVNHPDDPGGPTNKGITLATFRRYIKPSATIADLKALTVEQATVVYKRQYWDAVMADMLPAGVDYCVADFAVNSGPARAARYLQAAVGVAQDGKVGPRTIEAAAKADATQLINAICDARMKFLKGLLTWPKFGRGWTARVADVRAVSLAWAAAERAKEPRIGDVALTVPGQPTSPPTGEKPGPGFGIGAVIAFLLAGAGVAITEWWDGIKAALGW